MHLCDEEVEDIKDCGESALYTNSQILPSLLL